MTTLLDRVLEEIERAGDWQIQFGLDLSSAVALCANLQLALRHPGNRGEAADVARRIIDKVRVGLLDRGFSANAELIARGDDPAFDVAGESPR